VSLADRAAALGARAKALEAEKPRELTPEEERALHAAAERSNPRREWFSVTRDGVTFDLAFNPPVTLTEAMAKYPGCRVVEARR
jgi:hypothetical protein